MRGHALVLYHRQEPPMSYGKNLQCHMCDGEGLDVAVQRAVKTINLRMVL